MTNANRRNANVRDGVHRQRIDMAGEIIYGANAVREALRAGGIVNRLYLAKDSKVRGVRELVDLAKETAVPFDFIPLAKLNEITGTHEHQGAAASISPVAYAELDDFLAQCPDRAIVLALDKVQHPKNLGMLVRTAVGAGVSAILLSARGGALLDESVVRASAGTVFHIPVIACSKLPAALKKLKDNGFWVYGLDASGSENVFDVRWPERSVLVMGNETKGLSSNVAKACDVMTSIPLARELDSLNVSVAAGIAMFQAAYGRR